MSSSSTPTRHSSFHVAASVMTCDGDSSSTEPTDEQSTSTSQRITGLVDPLLSQTLPQRSAEAPPLMGRASSPVGRSEPDISHGEPSDVQRKALLLLDTLQQKNPHLSISVPTVGDLLSYSLVSVLLEMDQYAQQRGLKPEGDDVLTIARYIYNKEISIYNRAKLTQLYLRLIRPPGQTALGPSDPKREIGFITQLSDICDLLELTLWRFPSQSLAEPVDPVVGRAWFEHVYGLGTELHRLLQAHVTLSDLPSDSGVGAYWPQLKAKLGDHFTNVSGACNERNMRLIGCLTRELGTCAGHVQRLFDGPIPQEELSRRLYLAQSAVELANRLQAIRKGCWDELIAGLGLFAESKHPYVMGVVRAFRRHQPPIAMVIIDYLDAALGCWTAHVMKNLAPAACPTGDEVQSAVSLLGLAMQNALLGPCNIKKPSRDEILKQAVWACRQEIEGFAKEADLQFRQMLRTFCLERNWIMSAQTRAVDLSVATDKVATIQPTIKFMLTDLVQAFPHWRSRGSEAGFVDRYHAELDQAKQSLLSTPPLSEDSLTQEQAERELQLITKVFSKEGCDRARTCSGLLEEFGDRASQENTTYCARLFAAQFLVEMMKGHTACLADEHYEAFREELEAEEASVAVHTTTSVAASNRSACAEAKEESSFVAAVEDVSEGPRLLDAIQMQELEAIAVRRVHRLWEGLTRTSWNALQSPARDLVGIHIQQGGLHARCSLRLITLLRQNGPWGGALAGLIPGFLYLTAESFLTATALRKASTREEEKVLWGQVTRRHRLSWRLTCAGKNPDLFACVRMNDLGTITRYPNEAREANDAVVAMGAIDGNRPDEARPSVEEIFRHTLIVSSFCYQERETPMDLSERSFQMWLSQCEQAHPPTMMNLPGEINRIAGRLCKDVEKYVQGGAISREARVLLDRLVKIGRCLATEKTIPVEAMGGVVYGLLLNTEYSLLSIVNDYVRRKAGRPLERGTKLESAVLLLSKYNPDVVDRLLAYQVAMEQQTPGEPWARGKMLDYPLQLGRGDSLSRLLESIDVPEGWKIAGREAPRTSPDLAQLEAYLRHCQQLLAIIAGGLTDS